MTIPWKARRDANEPAIVAALRALGARVHLLSGKDIPDLLVGCRDEIRLVEVKTPKGKLKPGQARFARRWPVVVLRTQAEAIAWYVAWARS